ncbi:MAG: flagellar biosynthesis protein FlhF, partial [Rhodocyclaceae bacterium]
MTVKRFFGETAREALRKVKVALGPEAIVISNKAVPGGVEIMAMSPDTLEALQAATMPPASAAAPARPPAAQVSAPQPRTVASVAPAPRADATPPHAGPPPLRAASAPTFDDDEEEGDDYAVTLSAKARAPQAVHAWQPWQPPRQEAPTPAPAEKPKLRPLPPRQSVAEEIPAEEQVAAALAQVNAPATGATPQPGNDLQVQQLMDEMRAIKLLLERQLAGFAWGDLTRHAPVRAQLLGEMLEAGFSG